MPTVQAIVDVQYPQLAGVFDLGDKVEIKPVLLSERKLLSSPNVHSYFLVERSKMFIKGNFKPSTFEEYGEANPAHYAEAGTYDGFTVKSKNGVTYDDKDFYRLIGYRSLPEIFSRIN